MRDTAIKAGLTIRFAAEDMTEGVLRRLRDEQRGQTAAEYLGIILLVAVIIAAVVGSGIAGDIRDRIGVLIENIGRGGKPEGAPGPDGG
jgi:Flp pilus assembly pilin Flp